MIETVTVVIPTYDAPELVRTTVASVLGQVGVEVQVVVVDDGGPRAVAPDLFGDDPRVRVLRNEVPTGVSRARNRGIEASRTRWTACLDHDDLWAPRKLVRQLEALAEVPGARWAVSGAAHFLGDGSVVRVLMPPSSGDVLPVLLRSNCIPGGGSGVLAETELLREVGGFASDVSILADWDCWVRLADRSPVATVRRPDVGYRQHVGSMSYDLERTLAELRQFASRHAAAVARTGSRPDELVATAHLERMAYRGRQRRQALRLSRELVLRHRRWRSVPRPVLGLLPQRATDRLTGLASRWSSPELYREATTWLAEQLPAGQAA